MSDRLNLNGIWRLKNPEWDKDIEGAVPGSVLAQLLEEGMTEDPYWRTNEYKARELFREDYEYSYSFAASEQVLSADEISLVFEGIDTIADIYLNDKLLGRAKDMHRVWSFDGRDNSEYEQHGRDLERKRTSKIPSADDYRAA